MIELPGVGWHVFSTHDVPWRIVRPCLERNAELVDRTYAWVNNPVALDTLQGLVSHEAVSGLAVTREEGVRRFIPMYDLPYQVGMLCQEWLQGLKGLPGWVCFHDDDDTYPASARFPQYLADWIESGSRLMLMRQFYLWHHPGVIRVDDFRTVGWHARYAKVPSDGLRWGQTRCRPHVDEDEAWTCPWPLLHYTVFDEELRQRYHDRNEQRNPGGARGDDRRFWVQDPRAVLMKLDPEMVESDYIKLIRAVTAGDRPSDVWEHDDGSWLLDFESPALKEV